MTDTLTITIRKATKNNLDFVQLYFPYQRDLIDLIKSKTPARWSQTERCWYMQTIELDLVEFRLIIGKIYSINLIGFNHKQAIELPSGYLEKLQQKRYSPNTIKTYMHYFKDFIQSFSPKKPGEITHEEINHYILKLIKEKKISGSQQNQRINAIKFYYEKILGNEKEYYNIERPRVQQRLPDVLSKEEVFAMLKATQNARHKCLIALIYSCGLRRSEAINMKLEDIDSKRMLIKIKGAKGNKDRYVQLAQSTLELLRRYYKEERPQYWLFEGQKGQQYSATSILKDIKNAGARAGIKKWVYTHILNIVTQHII